MKRLVKLCLSGLVLSLCLSGVAQAAVELSLNLITPPGHLRNENLIRPWIKMVEEKSGGSLKITPYYAASMAPVPQAYEAAVTGIADISEGIIYSTPGVFPLTEMIMLPDLGIGSSSMQYCLNMMKALREVPEVAQEWKDAKVLWLHAAAPTVILTRDKQVKTVEDLAGMKIRVSGSTSVRIGEQLGFTPVAVDISELYQAMEKGVVDGVLMNYELLVSRRLGEVTRYITRVPMVTDAFFMVMNWDSWNALSAEHKKILEELSGDWGARAAAEAWDKNDKLGEEAYPQIVYYTPPAEELAKFQKLLDPIKREYADGLEKKGLPARRVLEVLMSK